VGDGGEAVGDGGQTEQRAAGDGDKGCRIGGAGNSGQRMADRQSGEGVATAPMARWRRHVVRRRQSSSRRAEEDVQPREQSSRKRWTLQP
jgi:hypothetical protein